MLRVDVEQQPVADGDRARPRRTAVGGETKHRICTVGVLVDQQRAGGERARPVMRREIQPTEGISRDRRPTRPHLAPAQRAVVVSVQADRLVEIAECYVPATVDTAIIDAQREIALARLMGQSRCTGQGENQHAKAVRRRRIMPCPIPSSRRGHDRS